MLLHNDVGVHLFGTSHIRKVFLVQMVGKNMLLIFHLDKLRQDTTNISATFNFYADPIMVLNI